MSETLIPSAEFLHPTFKRAAIVWWALFWRGLLLGCATAFVIVFLEGLVGALAGISNTIVRPVTLVSAALLGIPIGIYVLQFVLCKRFGEFTIRLVSTKAQP
jgi:hypothetical protein